MYRSGSKPLTPAAMSLRSFSVGNSVMKSTPDRPASRLCQKVGTSFPTGVTTPSPVTATRRRMGLGGLEALLDLGAEVADGAQLDEVLVGDHHAELRLELAHDLHHRQRVDAAVGHGSVNPLELELGEGAVMDVEGAHAGREVAVVVLEDPVAPALPDRLLV